MHCIYALICNLVKKKKKSHHLALCISIHESLMSEYLSRERKNRPKIMYAI